MNLSKQLKIHNLYILDKAIFTNIILVRKSVDILTSIKMEPTLMRKEEVFRHFQDFFRSNII